MKRLLFLAALLFLALQASPSWERGEAFRKGHEAQSDAEKIGWFNKAFELSRADEAVPRAWAFNNIGFVYIRANKWEEAFPFMEKSVKECGTIDVGRNNLGIVYENLFYVKKDLSLLRKAVACYGSAIALKPDLEKYRLNKERAEMLLAKEESAAQGKK